MPQELVPKNLNMGKVPVQEVNNAEEPTLCLDAIRCNVLDGAVRARVPTSTWRTGSHVYIPSEIISRSVLLSDLVADAIGSEAFTLTAPAQWLEAWVKCASELATLSPISDTLDTRQIAQGLLVRFCIT